MRVPAVLPAEESGDRIIGRSPVIQEMSKAIGRIAPQDVNVLILGESGTGKELVARALYHHSGRSGQPFLAINCAAIPETLLESELFGHERGAFTGADRRRIGKFEQCNAGTLFLDEIGDMTLALQAKMLRVLQDQRFERIGGNETIESHARILAATNQDLAGLISEGRFRKDLYYRLNVVSIHIPPLRQRLGDVAELAHFFLYRFDRELGLDLRAFAPETLELFQEYSWPGNVRELQSVVKQAMLNASGHVLLPEFLPEHVQSSPGPAPSALPLPESFDLETLIESRLKSNGGHLHDEVIAAVERLLFERVLLHTEGHQGKASEFLGLNRATLRHKMRALGLSVDRTVASAESAGSADGSPNLES
jgi:two-component system nitrogen regulation response regulator GlnG